MLAKNLSEDDNLPVKFFAAIALERLVENNRSSKRFVKPYLDKIIRNYLDMMNEFDNEELAGSFENMMKMFINEIKPYALNIVEHLKTQYFKCVNAD
jgi:hypothetical protein